MKRYLIILLSILLSVGAFAANLTISVIDVGQADSILVQFPNGQNMLVDAGTKAAGPAVVKYLKSRNVKKIDVLVATHPHEDHIGGMPSVFAAFPVTKVWDSGFNQGSKTQQLFMDAVKAKKCQYGKPKRGFVTDIGDVKIQVLAPGPTFLTKTHGDANNASLVLRLVYDQFSILLTGDMEAEARKAWGPWPASTVLKVSHHGSSNGTDAEFVSAVKPRYAIMSYGKNSYGHPHESAKNALAGSGAKLYSTNASGTIVITSDGKTTTVKGLGKGKAASASGTAVSSSTTAKKASGGGTVYITNSGAKFHKGGCRHLARSQIPISRADAIARGYSACSVCKP